MVFWHNFFGCRFVFWHFRTHKKNFFENRKFVKNGRKFCRKSSENQRITLFHLDISDAWIKLISSHMIGAIKMQIWVKKFFASEAPIRVHTIFPKNEDFLKTTQNERIPKNGIFQLLGQTCLYRKRGCHPPSFFEKIAFYYFNIRKWPYFSPKKVFWHNFFGFRFVFSYFRTHKKNLSKIANLRKTCENASKISVKI